MKQVFFLFAAVLSVSGAKAQAPATPSALPPDAAKHTGNYVCEGSFRNGKLHRANYTVNVVVGGKWLQMTEQDVEPATGYAAEYLIGYDWLTKHVVEFNASNSGSAVLTSEAGWEKNVLTLVNSTSLPGSVTPVVSRFVYTFDSNDSFVVDWGTRRRDEWATMDHLACKRK